MYVSPAAFHLQPSLCTAPSRRTQAIAKQSGATFINVRMGAVQQKYVGEGEKMVAAIFRCANTRAGPALPVYGFSTPVAACLRRLCRSVPSFFALKGRGEGGR